MPDAVIAAMARRWVSGWARWWAARPETAPGIARSAMALRGVRRISPAVRMTELASPDVLGQVVMTAMAMTTGIPQKNRDTPKVIAMETMMFAERTKGLTVVEAIRMIVETPFCRAATRTDGWTTAETMTITLLMTANCGTVGKLIRQLGSRMVQK